MVFKFQYTIQVGIKSKLSLDNFISDIFNNLLEARFLTRGRQHFLYIIASHDIKT